MNNPRLAVVSPYPALRAGLRSGSASERVTDGSDGVSMPGLNAPGK